MKKEFIRDGKRIRMCDKNVASMTPIEHIYCNLIHWNAYGIVIRNLIEAIKEAIEGLCGLVIELIRLILLPIILVIYAFHDIKDTKKRIDRKRGAKNGY